MQRKILTYTQQFEYAEKHPELPECPSEIKNIGWSLGNACPYHCKQCYSLSVRKKGMDITTEMVDRVISQIEKLQVKTVNIGGNEPWFTNGITGSSILPYIIEKLYYRGIKIGITTSGITLIRLFEQNPEILRIINDVDISLDSPYEEEHNKNRGAQIYGLAIRALEICTQFNIAKSIIMCAMKWNFTIDRVKELIKIAKKNDANIRFNMLKPVISEHIEQIVPAEQFFLTYEYLLKNCETIDITEPFLSGVTKNEKSHRCPCGRTSLRIHSITPNGEIPISPCVYLHDYKVGDILKDDIIDIINSEPFKEFRRRNQNPNFVRGCEGCEFLSMCGGGCTAKAYLYNFWNTGNRSIYIKEPNCPKNLTRKFPDEYIKTSEQKHSLVHQDYLCTWIGKPI